MVDPVTDLGTANPAADSFGEFFAAEYERLSRMLYLLATDHAEAEDLAQEAMARVYERWPRVSAMEAPAGYVYRVAINLHRRRSRRRLRTTSPTPSTTVDPATLVEDRDEIVHALRALSAEQREAVVLVGWLGYDAEAAGRILGIDAASVRGWVHRARTTLRDRLGGRDG